MSRLRNFVFTLNNYSEDDIEKLKNIKDIKYCIFGKEVGEKGTLHLQGYVEMKKQYRFGTIKKMFGNGYHIEARRGSQEEAIKYCKKDGDFFEFGKKASQGKRSDLERVKEMLFVEKKNIKEVLLECTSYQALRGAQILNVYKEPRLEDIPKEVLWFWGPTGTGKTRTAVAEAGSDKWISGENLKWFDGYYGQEVAILDDFRKDFCTYHFLLRILDRYPLKVPVKGSFVDWEPKKIYITSCFHPEGTYRTREDIDQLIRRISVIKEFKKVEEEQPKKKPKILKTLAPIVEEKQEENFFKLLHDELNRLDDILEHENVEESNK